MFVDADFCDLCFCEEFKLKKCGKILKNLARFSSENVYLRKIMYDDL